MNTKRLKGPQGDEQYINLMYLRNGGMGFIYLANDTQNQDAEVAIKITPVDNPNTKDLLIEEFKMAASLRHPNIAKTHFYGEFTDNTGNYIYSVMDYFQNGDLGDLLQNSSLLPIDTCMNLFTQLLKGLQAAHKLIVHRDLKPGNILVGENGELQICDFGISKYKDHSTRQLTFKGYGSLAYMSPECWLSETNTVRMDIYSLGIIFFEILTLSIPFKGQTDQDWKIAHLTTPLPDMKSHRSDIPYSLVNIIKKMTSKKAKDRYEDVAAILTDLQGAEIIQNKYNLDDVLHHANKKANAITAEALAQEKAKLQREETNSILSYSIKELFNQITDISQAFNQQSVTEQITHTERLQPYNPYEASYTLTLFGKTLTIAFFKKEFSNFHKEQELQYYKIQNDRFGYVRDKYTPGYIVKDRVMLVGKVIVNDLRFEMATRASIAEIHPAGFNIVLLKTSDSDLYGSWYTCKFSPMPLYSNMPNYYVAMEHIQDFLNNYEYSRGSVISSINMTFDELKDADFIELIKLLPQMD
ncbi:Serine/threonine protein kinase [Filimonas lacunae]|uniref:Serine/threonine protein kinase n=1 Tax=Filimonas lacunae TaxID=477680 RepID=A0A173MA89_9BACT|nr:serine/threonine-protein kinase [Filimonas lacunae]BAV04421.1 serine/threonine protein kinase PrkC, regulator of stationary phase [Filimonas lacunae]SIT31398.1 Serine/threonine protein kinase [Filimonas lacunae]